MNTFRVIICGSREFNDYELLKNKCDFYLKRIFSNPEKKVIVVSGGARGADTLGELYAKERGLDVQRYPANWDKYGKSAGYLRNKQMAEVGNACIAFLSQSNDTSKNRGTKMMISIAREEKLLVRVVEDSN